MPMTVHFDIATDDPERAKKFYEALFDWRMGSSWHEHDAYWETWGSLMSRPGRIVAAVAR